MQLSLLLAIGTGGFIGAILRFTISTWMQKLFSPLFPIGTLTVNILGSFIIGFMALYFENVISPHQKALIITGMLGALTTFSTFSLETVTMLQEGLWGRAFANITLNTFLCILATIIGMTLFKRIYG
ncbi:fluoride efflux transporter CrcB [Hydrogenimonas thermophila]|uniref:fluoride efflux transporter CrcB n=1 Tax=Hydrogenimonas thermophila TaxID=223786 RepID=UPI00293702F8|nr:fluoride efflux transporter CrcB [Hydrogenimonas thermophila]WOE70590.1 fluoride efflux transporter CrcB [Hydrogenimonas thermophila]WOE73108.1 fluoride efflux transporter CrcB [Hydrogenimonas thermophila]